MADEEKDPLSLLVFEVCKTLETHPRMKRAMGLAIKNFRTFTKHRDKETPDTVGDSDVPEIIIEPNGGPTNINTASNLVSMDMGFTLTINSGDQRIVQFMYPVLWATYAVLANGIGGSPITALRWRDRPFCHKYEFSAITAGKSNPEVNRGVKGWTAICSLIFHLHFQKADIDAFVNMN